MIVTYWIVFKNTEHPWKYFLKDKFSHVIVVYRDFDNFWRVIDPTVRRLDDSYAFMSDIKQNDCDLPAILRKSGLPVVKITKEYSRACFPPTKWYHIRLGCYFNCFRICCYCMGIKPMGVTPYGFYKKLQRLSRFDRNIERYHAGIETISFLG